MEAGRAQRRKYVETAQVRAFVTVSPLSTYSVCALTGEENLKEFTNLFL